MSEVEANMSLISTYRSSQQELEVRLEAAEEEKHSLRLQCEELVRENNRLSSQSPSADPATAGAVVHTSHEAELLLEVEQLQNQLMQQVAT